MRKLDFQTNYNKYFSLLEYPIENKYLIGYNCDKMPTNFIDFTRLNLNVEKSEQKDFNGDNYLMLNRYNEVIIELEDKNFEFIIGGASYEVVKGKKYITKFPIYHEFCIKIVPNLKIYVNRNHNNNNNNYDVNLLKYMFQRINVIMYNFDVLSEDNDINNMMLYSGLAFSCKNKFILADKTMFIKDLNDVANNFCDDYNRDKTITNKIYLDTNTFISFINKLISTDTIQIYQNNNRRLSN